jgi:beta-phosphoglucomutase
MIKGVLFDMDGVLTDSEAFICLAGVEMFREKGLKVNGEDFKPFTGMGEDRYLGGVAEKYGFPFDVQKDKARTYEIYKEIVRGRLTVLPGVFEFIDKCRGLGLSMAIASSADEIKVMTNLNEIGLPPSLFGAVIHGQHVVRKKPFPDIFIRAADEINLRPQQCLVIEDAVSGVKAAKDAGCRCLALTTSFNEDQLKDADWIAVDLSMAPDECINW